MNSYLYGLFDEVKTMSVQLLFGLAALLDANENDDIGDHTPLSFDRYGITNINNRNS